jgi:alpha-L-fucosidase 2
MIFRAITFPALFAAVLLGGGALHATDATLKRDIIYGEAGGETLRLDASVPAGEGPFPIAILVHGGGWTRGDKAGSDHPGDTADVSPWFAPLTAARFTWFSINYRLAPAHRWPACYDDVRTAIRWVKAHASDYRGDPQRIVLFGHSAGGHLVCLAVTEADETTRVQAVVGFAPVTDFEYELPHRGGLSPSLQALLDQPHDVTPASLAILREIAPVTHVRAGLPPFLLVQGDADRTVPIEETRRFAARLRDAGVAADLQVIAGAPHRLLAWADHDPRYMDQVIAWVNRHLTLPPASSSAAQRQPAARVARRGAERRVAR